MSKEAKPAVNGQPDHKAMQQRVAAAEQAVKSKHEELKDANATVARLNGELSEATDAMRKAREDADALLPQCRMLIKRWGRAQEEDIGRVVLLRKTPGGMLVVRRVGGPPDTTFKFKWRETPAAYVLVDKHSSFASDTRILRDVPAEYMPEVVK